MSSENEKLKRKWRGTKAWKTLRHNIISKQKLDALTNKKLSKGCSVHHCDLNPLHYADLDESKYIALNSNSHKVIHFIWNYYEKDPAILDRLEKIMLKMKELNYGDKRDLVSD